MLALPTSEFWNLIILLVSTLLRCFGADVVQCHLEGGAEGPVSTYPDLELNEDFDFNEEFVCGIQFGADRLWLFPTTWHLLPFDKHGLQSITTSSAAGDLTSWWPNGVGWENAFWIHRSGIIRHTHYFDNSADRFEQGLVRYVDERGKFGFMNRNLKIVIAAQFDFAHPFEENGRASMCVGCVVHSDGEVDWAQRSYQCGGRSGTVDARGRIRWPRNARTLNCPIEPDEQ